jgi:hypothetical protein
VVAPAEFTPRLDVDAVVLDVSAFAGGARVFADGVNNTDPVSAFEPADVEPLPEEDEAGAPLCPAEEFDSM